LQGFGDQCAKHWIIVDDQDSLFGIGLYAWAPHVP
jgi:hypothetical protein